MGEKLKSYRRQITKGEAEKLLGELYAERNTILETRTQHQIEYEDRYKLISNANRIENIRRIIYDFDVHT